ncbi:uncharacterized protein BKA78DRAFT_37220 [Phyllosticta capitalensis]|uniref:uncharacterized protein n=1 Tax=Phyllosticta capitalensis TaxID=121624 RepID=UPI00312D9DA4
MHPRSSIVARGSISPYQDPAGAKLSRLNLAKPSNLLFDVAPSFSSRSFQSASSPPVALFRLGVVPRRPLLFKHLSRFSSLLISTPPSQLSRKSIVLSFTGCGEDWYRTRAPDRPGVGSRARRYAGIHSMSHSAKSLNPSCSVKCAFRDCCDQSWHTTWPGANKKDSLWEATILPT